MFKRLIARVFTGIALKRLSLFLVASLFVAAVASAASGQEIKAAASEGVGVAVTSRSHLTIARRATASLAEGLSYDKAKTVGNFALLGKEKLTVIIPGENYGGASVVLDKSGTVLSTMVIKNAIVDEGASVHSMIYVDGTQVGDLTVDSKTGSLTSGWRLAGGEKVAMEKGNYGPTKDGDVSASRLTWGCFRDCLINVMGVPSWLIGFMGAVCAVVCALTVGTGCIACAIAVLIGYGAEISFCLGWCSARR